MVIELNSTFNYINSLFAHYASGFFSSQRFAFNIFSARLRFNVITVVDRNDSLCGCELIIFARHLKEPRNDFGFARIACSFEFAARMIPLNVQWRQRFVFCNENESHFTLKVEVTLNCP
jgi:hypothetical protein